MRIYSIDIMKCIMACFIVAIHIRPLSNINAPFSYIMEQVIGRLGVPFFFMTSGFFCMKMLESDKRKFMNHIKKILYYYVMFSVLYILWETMQQYSPVGIIGMIKRFLFYGTYYHLWYFPALIIALLLMAVSNQYRFFFVYSLFGGVTYVLIVFTNTWFGIGVQLFPMLENMMTHFDFTYVRSFLGLAVPYTILGGVIWKTRDRWSKLSKRKVCYCLVISQILYFLEIYVANRYNCVQSTSTSFFLLPSVWFMMIFIFQHPGKEIRYGDLLRRSSLLLYGLHPLFFEIYQNLLGNTKYNAIKPMLIYIFTIATIEMIVLLFAKRRRKGHA